MGLRAWREQEMSKKSEQGWRLADGYRDQLVTAKARNAELEKLVDALTAQNVAQNQSNAELEAEVKRLKIALPVIHVDDWYEWKQRAEQAEADRNACAEAYENETTLRLKAEAENERLDHFRLMYIDMETQCIELEKRAEQAEAERDTIFHEFTDDMTNSSDEWLVTFEWLQKDFPHLAAHYSRTEKGEE
jgi:hypothetical protein